MEINIIRDIIIIFALAIFVIFAFHKLKLPSILGFLLTGIITGPYGLKLIHGTEEVEILAEIGIILLLFTIGIEFSVKSLLKTKRSVLLGGGLQVGLVILAVYVINKFSGLTNEESIFTGFLVALSSTAIVMKIIQSKGELGTFHGQTTLSILIFQDLIIIPMILITPILAGESSSPGQSFLFTMLKGLLFIGAMIIAARFVIPKLLYQIAKTQSRELFLLTTIVIGFSTAWFSSSIGLSLALGAFIAGLMISESEYSEQAFGNIIPFKDLFVSFFFVSVGMLLNLQFVFDNFLIVIIVSFTILFLKTFVSGLVAFVLGFPFRTTVIVGLTLSQVGEFSFILSKIGIQYNLLSEFNYQLFLASSVITISLTPFIINLAPKLADYILRFNIPRKLRCGLNDLNEEKPNEMDNHVIIIGYGINGKNVAKAAKYANIPHVIIELNPDTVKEELAKGEVIYYGDATQEEILEHANINNALVVVITLPHPADTRLITEKCRRLNPHVHIIIRTRYIQDMAGLYELGADEVIPEEFETSIEIFSRVMAKFLVPHDQIVHFIDEIRADGYKMFRSLSLSHSNYKNLEVKIPQVEIHSYHVCKNSHVIGKTIEECNFENYQMNLLALNRGTNVYSRPEINMAIEVNDILFFLGPNARLNEFSDLFCEQEFVDIK
ncbi:MAG: cation:proton antiporter [Bacteroidales bacterium]